MARKQLQNNHIAATHFHSLLSCFICVDNHIRVGDSRILWIWRHTKPPWVRCEACGYADYGFRSHSRHTAVLHTGAEAWSYAAILQNGIVSQAFESQLWRRHHTLGTATNGYVRQNNQVPMLKKPALTASGNPSDRQTMVCQFWCGHSCTPGSMTTRHNAS